MLCDARFADLVLFHTSLDSPHVNLFLVKAIVPAFFHVNRPSSEQDLKHVFFSPFMLSWRDSPFMLSCAVVSFLCCFLETCGSHSRFRLSLLFIRVFRCGAGQIFTARVFSLPCVQEAKGTPFINDENKFHPWAESPRACLLSRS